MRASKFLIPTLKEAPGDAVVASHKFMFRAGLVRKLGAGLYHLLPLGLRVFRKIENIIREEMDQSGAMEFQLPILTPSDVWKKSGRWDSMGKEMMRISDRHSNWNVLGPTHEESFTELMKGMIRSHKDLPMNVYQIHTKFRDEVRPRYGVIRSREFCMKDAYSFNKTEEDLNETYQQMRVTYRRIFARAGLKTVPVEADSGTMGGAGSEEFMVPSAIGEETLLISEGGKYHGNQEKTPLILNGDALAPKAASKAADLEKVETPAVKTIEDLEKFFEAPATSMLKTVMYRTEEQTVAVCIRADRQVNEVKLKNALDCTELFPASDGQIKTAGSVPGFIGPLGLNEDVNVLWDNSINFGADWITGANELDQHFKGFNPGKVETRDLALAVTGDPSPEGDGPLKEMKGIEVGHIFKLGDKYAKAFEVTYLDNNGKAQTPLMGCYGIGVNRTMATTIEQCHDEKGIIWPVSTAPFEVALVDLTKKPEEKEQVEKLYQELLKQGLDVLWDDRDQRPGVKFADAELIGYPIRLTMGKGYFNEGKLEVRLRHESDNRSLEGDIPSLAEETRKLRDELYKELDKKYGGEN